MQCPACNHDNIQGVDLCAECSMDLAGLDIKAWGVDPDDPLLVRPLSDLPLKKPIVASAETSAAEAIERMRDGHEGCVFIEDPAEGLVGVFTERDVTTRIAARGRDPKQTRLGDVMTRNPVALQKQDPLSWALHRMGVDGHRHVPVLDHGKLIGFLSVRMVLSALLEA